jgi:hypothetical protein
MRLLRSGTLELREFPNHDELPYAILSHTWANEEVLFQDIEGLNIETIPSRIKQKLGYKKIEACCAQAARDGFEYVWIDTCCIDKRSSAELSEAINSMYQWYQDCAVCYAYLADVPNNGDRRDIQKKFRNSRWFTRGWTLQELIAPSSLEFYGDQWHSEGQQASLGTKRSLGREISEVTKIPEWALLTICLGDCSVAQKMSWAANRETTRIEDRAYSLMGLFNVHMPLLYGEGARAFIRLQEEIMKTSADESLFAWVANRPGPRPALFQGLLAMSPACFYQSGRIIPKLHSKRSRPFNVTNMGLQLELMLPKTSDVPETRTFKSPYNQISPVYVAVLNCVERRSGHAIGILLGHFSGGDDTVQEAPFVRINASDLVFINLRTYKPSESDCTTILARLAETTDSLADIYARRVQNDRESRYRSLWLQTFPNNFPIIEFWPKHLWSKVRDEMWIEKLEGQITQLPSWCSAAILFSNDVDAFVVRFGYLMGKPWVQVQHQSLGEPLEDIFIPKVSGGVDRATHSLGPLGSRGIVSVAFRPQRANGYWGYALYVSVDHSSSAL